LATLTAVKPSGRFGELSLEDQTITAFHEKPEQEDAYINGGFMVFNRGIIDSLPNDDCILEREPMDALAADSQLKAFCHDGFWQCMDTYREQQLLEGLWNSGQAPWKIW
jgi:glucose-1-phosphate cytidylyltransferase